MAEAINVYLLLRQYTRAIFAGNYSDELPLTVPKYDETVNMEGAVLPDAC